MRKNRLNFIGEELYWDQNSHELWSNKYSCLITPERRLEGRYFKSDERMTRYYVSNTKGSFEKGDIDSSPRDTMTAVERDSSMQTGRQRQSPLQKKSPQTIPLLKEL